MTKDEALDLALEALEICEQDGYIPVRLTRDSITAIKQARSAPTVGEPVAIADGTFNHNCPIGTPLYTTAAQRPFVGLTDDEMDELVNRFARYELVRAVENLLRSKNA